MRKKLFGRLLSAVLSTSLIFTSVIPSYAMEGEYGIQDVESEEGEDAADVTDAADVEKGLKTADLSVEDDDISGETPEIEVDEPALVKEISAIIITFTGYVSGEYLSANGSREGEIGSNSAFSLPDPVREGYTFTGFTAADDQGVTVGDHVNGQTTFTIDSQYVTTEETAITLTVGWTANTYTVHFNANVPSDEYSIGTMSDQSFTYDVEQALSENLFSLYSYDDPRYRFAGWSLTPSGEVAYTDKQVVSNLTADNNTTVDLYAVWVPIDYATITFDANGGYIDDYYYTKSIQLEKETNFPDAPYTAERNYYEFVKWNTEEDGSGDDYSTTNTVTGDVTYYAIWDGETYPITFDFTNGGAFADEAVYPATVKFGVAFGQIDDPVLAGYTFNGWTTSVHDYYYGYSIDKDTVLDEYNYNSYVSNNAVKAYAHWGANNYTVRFNPNAPEGKTVIGEMTDQEFVYDDEAYALKANEFNIEGLYFNGWATSPAGDKVYNDKQKVKNLTAVADGVVDLYAVWTDIATCTVTFDPNNTYYYMGTATGSMDDMEITTAETKALTVNRFSRAGYEFAGWSTYYWYSTPEYLDQEVIDGLELYKNGGSAVTLYAIWTPNAEVTLTFESNGGNVINPVIVYSGGYLYDFEDEEDLLPVRKGWNFDGWYDNAELSGTAADFTNNAITESKTYFAKWTPQEYVIIFDKNNAQATGTMSDESMTVGTKKALTKNAFNCDGMVFVCWSTNPTPELIAGTSYQDEAVVDLFPEEGTSPLSRTLYAQWREEDEFVVTFDVGLGAGITPVEPSAYISQTVKEGQKAVKPEVDPKRAGFEFKYWRDAGETQSKAFDFSKGIKKDTNLAAEWKVEKYTIKYDSNGGSGKVPDQTFTLEEGFRLSDNRDKNGRTILKRLGYDYDGWLVILSNKKQYYSAGYPVNESNAAEFVKWANNKNVISAKANWKAVNYLLKIYKDKECTQEITEVRSYEPYSGEWSTRKLPNPNYVNVQDGFTYNNLPWQYIYNIVNPGEKFTGFIRKDTGEKVMPGSKLKLTKEPENNTVKVYTQFEPVAVEVTAVTDIPETKKATKTFKGGTDNDKTFGPKTMFGQEDSDSALVGFAGYSSNAGGATFFYGPQDNKYKVEDLMVKALAPYYMSKSSSSSSKNGPKVPSKVKCKITAAHDPTARNSYTVKVVVNKSGNSFSEEGYTNKKGFEFKNDGSGSYVHEQNVLKGETLTLTGNEVQKKGSTLTGYSVQKIDSNNNVTEQKKLKPNSVLKDAAKPGETLVLTGEFTKSAPNKITYVMNGGKYEGTDKNDKLPATYEYDKPVSEAEMLAYTQKLVKKGYELKGLYKDKACTQEIRSLGKLATGADETKNVEDGPLTIYCAWEGKHYLLKFTGLNDAKDSEGNAVTGGEKTITVSYDETIDLSKYKFTKEGYDLKSWKGEGTASFKPNQKLKNLSEGSGTGEAIIQYNIEAVFVPFDTNLSYDLDGGTLPTGTANPGKFTTSDETANSGKGIEIKTPEKKGHTFIGYTDDSGQLVITNEEATEATKYGDLDSPKKVVKVFVKRATSKKAIKKMTAKLKAKYKKNRYKIKIKKKDGTVIYTVSRKKWKLVTAPNDAEEPLADNEFVFTDKLNLSSTASYIDKKNNSGKSIIGFATSPDGPVVFDTVSDYDVSKLAVTMSETPEENTITLYPVEGDGQIFRIDYDLDEYPGTTMKKPIYSYKPDTGKDISLPSATVTGYKFKKWTAIDYDDSGRIVLLDNVLTDDGLKIKKGTTGSITLKPEFDSLSYKVKLDPNGKNVKLAGNEMPGAVDVANGKAIKYSNGKRAEDDVLVQLPDDYTLTREGYTLVGYGLTRNKVDIELSYADSWAPLKGLTTKASVTVYAIWKGKARTVEYSEYGTLTVDSRGYSLGYTSPDISHFVHEMDSKYKTAIYGSVLTLPVPTVEGYTFKGWKAPYPDDGAKFVKDKNGYITKVNADNTADIYLVAEFVENKYTLKYNFNGGARYPGSKTKGTIKLGEFYYTQNIRYQLNTYAYKKGFKYIGNGLTKKAVSEIPNNKLTSKNKGSVTVYAIYTKNSVTTPGKIDAVYDINTKKVTVTVNDVDENVDGYIYELAIDPKFENVTCTMTRSGDDYYEAGDSFNTATFTGQTGVAGGMFYVRVKAFSYTLRDYGTEYATQSKWSKTVRAAKAFNVANN